LSTEDFNKQWALVNNFWTKYNSYILNNGDERKTFVCRLSKPHESSGRKENVLSEKLRITWKNPAINCEARIRITWLAASNMVRIERVSGTSDHSHSMKENNMRKRSKFIKDMIGNEAIKDYKLSTIADVIRKEASKLCEDSGIKYLKTKKVANIKQKLVEPMNSHLVGDANLKPDILNTIKFLIENNYQVESFQKQGSLEHLQGLCFANF
ncbi:14597_t:CDS:2, partial [Cetraspora pellucida]